MYCSDRSSKNLSNYSENMVGHLACCEVWTRRKKWDVFFCVFHYHHGTNVQQLLFRKFSFSSTNTRYNLRKANSGMAVCCESFCSFSDGRPSLLGYGQIISKSFNGHIPYSIRESGGGAFASCISETSERRAPVHSGVRRRDTSMPLRFTRVSQSQCSICRTLVGREMGSANKTTTFRCFWELGAELTGEARGLLFTGKLQVLGFASAMKFALGEVQFMEEGCWLWAFLSQLLPSSWFFFCKCRIWRSKCRQDVCQKLPLKRNPSKRLNGKDCRSLGQNTRSST